jgi:hypothetical protein
MPNLNRTGRTRSSRANVLDALARLHREVDACMRLLSERHAARLHCRRGCCDCCVDGITVFEVEAERIRRSHRELLASGLPHPPGACAFLGVEGVCRIYAERPYVCRTQGLPLRWQEEGDTGDPVEYRDICPLNDVTGEPVESLPADACWTIGPAEGRLAALQEGHGAGARRVALRSLFEEEPR